MSDGQVDKLVDVIAWFGLVFTLFGTAVILFLFDFRDELRKLRQGDKT